MRWWRWVSQTNHPNSSHYHTIIQTPPTLPLRTKPPHMMYCTQFRDTLWTHRHREKAWEVWARGGRGWGAHVSVELQLLHLGTLGATKHLLCLVNSLVCTSTARVCTACELCKCLFMPHYTCIFVLPFIQEVYITFYYTRNEERVIIRVSKLRQKEL